MKTISSLFMLAILGGSLGLLFGMRANAVHIALPDWYQNIGDKILLVECVLAVCVLIFVKAEKFLPSIMGLVAVWISPIMFAIILGGYNGSVTESLALSPYVSTLLASLILVAPFVIVIEPVRAYFQDKSNNAVATE